MKNKTLKLASAAVIAGCAAFTLISCGTHSGDNEPDVSEEFAFATDGPEAYRIIDRHGAVEAGTVGIAAAAGLGQAPIRDLYNASNPLEDSLGRWVSEISNSVAFLHAALDDDLRSVGLTPASLSQSLAQAGPVLIPDVIHYNPDLPTSYPNGRKLTDPVVDLTIAAALLDLNRHPITTLANLPLNPPANDVPFKTEFPYLADPHEPS